MLNPKIEKIVLADLKSLEETINQLQDGQTEGMIEAQCIRAILYTLMGTIKSGHLMPLADLTTAFSRQVVGMINEQQHDVLSASEIS